MNQDIHNYLLATSAAFRMPQYIAETENKEVEAPKLRSIDGDAFVTLLPLQSSRDFSDTEFWGSQAEVEVNPRGGNLVA